MDSRYIVKPSSLFKVHSHNLHSAPCCSAHLQCIFRCHHISRSDILQHIAVTLCGNHDEYRPLIAPVRANIYTRLSVALLLDTGLVLER
jgi:hypothetical protein